MPQLLSIRGYACGLVGMTPAGSTRKAVFAGCSALMERHVILSFSWAAGLVANNLGNVLRLRMEVVRDAVLREPILVADGLDVVADAVEVGIVAGGSEVLGHCFVPLVGVAVPGAWPGGGG